MLLYLISLLSVVYWRTYVLPLLLVFFISPQISQPANGWLVSMLRTVGVWYNFNIL